jgi:hypothetical protein
MCRRRRRISRCRTSSRRAAQETGYQQCFDQLFQLLTSVPLPAGVVDADLLRLRSAATLYEQRRVARVRRRFAFLLLGVLAYLLAVAPTVFIRLDNPHRATDALRTHVRTVQRRPWCDHNGVLAGLVLSTMTPWRLP